MQVYTGQYFALDAAVFDAGGTLVPHTQATFTTSDATVVALVKLASGNYQAQALKAGSANVVAHVNAVTSTLAVTVVDAGIPASIQINTGAAEYSPNG